MHSNKDNQTEAQNKKGDYWYIDRHDSRKHGAPKGLRVLGLVFAIALAVYCAACSAGNSGVLQMDDPQVMGTDATHGTSGLVGTTLGLASNVVFSGKWYIDGAVFPVLDGKLPFSATNDGRYLNLNSPYAIQKVELYYSDRSKDVIDARPNGGLFRLRPGVGFDGCMVRLKSDGSKWYFDNASGKWFSDVDSARWYGDVDNAQINQNQQ